MNLRLKNSTKVIRCHEMNQRYSEQQRRQTATKLKKLNKDQNFLILNIEMKIKL